MATERGRRAAPSSMLMEAEYSDSIEPAQREGYEELAMRPEA